MDKKEYEWATAFVLEMKLKYGAYEILQSELLNLVFNINLN